VVPAPGRHVVVAPPVGGILTGTTLARVGQTVARGETLGVVRQTATAAESAQVAAAQAQARVEVVRLEAEGRRPEGTNHESRIRRDHAKIELERAQALYDMKAIALRQLQIADADYRSAESALASAAAQRDAVSAARVADPTASVVGGSHVITAPISGTVVR